VGKFSDTACGIISCLVVWILPKKQHSNEVLPLGARGSGNYASPCSCLYVLCEQHCSLWF